jgi:hypothetical protein
MLTIKSVHQLKLNMDGMEYASELIDLVAKQQLSWREVPVNIHYDAYTLGK